MFNWRKRTVGLDVGKYSLSNRIANEWDILGEGITEANSLSGFKKD